VITQRPPELSNSKTNPVSQRAQDGVIRIKGTLSKQT
jgi:hypothetical protein